MGLERCPGCGHFTRVYSDAKREHNEWCEYADQDTPPSPDDGTAKLGHERRRRPKSLRWFLLDVIAAAADRTPAHGYPWPSSARPDHEGEET